MEENVEKKRFLVNKHFSIKLEIGTIVISVTNDLFHLDYITIFDNSKLIRKIRTQSHGSNVF
jgi:hypothetical protein